MSTCHMETPLSHIVRANEAVAYRLFIQSLVAALVLMKLDFGNATLAGVPLFQLDCLQVVMNAAARLVTL